MDASNLTITQLHSLLDHAEHDLAYYARLRKRLTDQGFCSDDPLFACVERTHHEVMELRMLLVESVINAEKR